MDQQLRTWSRRGRILFLIPWMLLGATGHAQDADDRAGNDVFMIRPEFRFTAATPVPFGLIVSGRATGPAYPIGEYHIDTGTDADFEIAAYYDVWQIAFRQRPYGNVAQVMIRSTGRDIYRGLFVEYGTRTTVIDHKGGSGRSETIESTNFGVGYRWASGYGPGISFVRAGECSIVFVHSTGGLLAQYGFGLRIPFGLSGLVACVQARYSSYNWKFERPAYIGDAQSQLGLGLMVQYGLNSEFQ